MTKKKVAKKSVRKSTVSSSRTSTQQGLFKKHPSLLLYLVLFVGVIIILYLMKVYKDAQDMQQVLDLNSVNITTPHLTVSPSISPSAAPTTSY